MSPRLRRPPRPGEPAVPSASGPSDPGPPPPRPPPVGDRGAAGTVSLESLRDGAHRLIGVRPRTRPVFVVVDWLSDPVHPHTLVATRGTHRWAVEPRDDRYIITHNGKPLERADGRVRTFRKRVDAVGAAELAIGRHEGRACLVP